MFNMAPRGILTLRIWELELLLSTKMAEAIRSLVTVWNWVTVQCQGHTEGFQDGFHSEQASQGSIKEVEFLCCAPGAESGFKKQTHECCQHCFRGCRSGRSACQCSDHTPHTVTSLFAWPSSQKEALLKLAHKKSLHSVCWRQPGQEHELLEPCPVV